MSNCILSLILLILISSNFIQECDQYTCESPQTCHRCTASRKNFLSSAVYQTKTVTTRRVQITEAAKGSDRFLRGMRLGTVVDWGEGEKPTHSPGPNSSHYEAFRTLCNACTHLFVVMHNLHNVCVVVVLRG